MITTTKTVSQPILEIRHDYDSSEFWNNDLFNCECGFFVGSSWESSQGYEITQADFHKMIEEAKRKNLYNTLKKAFFDLIDDDEDFENLHNNADAEDIYTTYAKVMGYTMHESRGNSQVESVLCVFDARSLDKATINTYLWDTPYSIVIYKNDGEVQDEINGVYIDNYDDLLAYIPADIKNHKDFGDITDYIVD